MEISTLFSTGTSESDTSSVEDLSDPSISSSSSYSFPSAPVRPLSLPLAPDATSYPLHTFAASGDLDKMKHYLGSHKQADVNQPMKDGSTPVHAAAEHGQQGTNASCIISLVK